MGCRREPCLALSGSAVGLSWGGGATPTGAGAGGIVKCNKSYNTLLQRSRHFRNSYFL